MCRRQGPEGPMEFGRKDGKLGVEKRRLASTWHEHGIDVRFLITLVVSFWWFSYGDYCEHVMNM